MNGVKDFNTKSNIAKKGTQNENCTIEIGEKVKIKKVTDSLKDKMDPEDYFYLKQFENKTSTISEIAESTSGSCSYRVDFDETRFGYFYSNDFEIIDK